MVIAPDGGAHVLSGGDVAHLPPSLQTGAVRDTGRDLKLPAAVPPPLPGPAPTASPSPPHR
jgi:hypothetical protein